MKQKGFTLIELLAVIVILAIIAVITVPMIMNVIDKAKVGALEDSAYGLIDAANLYYSQNVQSFTDKITFEFDNGKQTSEKKLNYKGQIESGKLILNTDGKIVLCIDDGTNYSYKNLTDTKVTSGKGICVYDGTTGNFTINSDIDTLNSQIQNLQNEIANGKEMLSTAITNMGVITSTSDSFETMAGNIEKINTGGKLILDVGNNGSAGTGSIVFNDEYFTSVKQTSNGTSGNNWYAAFQIVVKKDFTGIGWSGCNVTSNGKSTSRALSNVIGGTYFTPPNTYFEFYAGDTVTFTTNNAWFGFYILSNVEQ